MKTRDWQRCFNGAAYGITTGDHTQNTCPEHVAETIDSMITRHAQAVMVYAMQAKRRCDWRYDKRTETEPERSPHIPAHIPAAYCQRCANSGVGVCDDYPNCPAGRKASGQ